jgi:uncharacterized protein with von Willebrand factor type A (vWA) domain
MLYRYSRWDGTQEIETFLADDLMGEISEEILGDGDLRTALRRMFERGAQFPSGRRVQGLRELMNRLKQRRSQNLERYNLGGILDDLKERLDRILDMERSAIERRMDGERSPDDGTVPDSRQDGNQQPGEGETNGGEQGSPATGGGGGDPQMSEMLQRLAQRHLDKLDQLPPDVGGRIRDLREYDFMDPAARQEFDELMKMLQQQIMQQYFQGLQQGLQSMTPETMQQLREMVHDLNNLLEQRLRGERPDISDFMQKWGQFFPDGIQDVDQLAEYLQQQMAQMESLLNSMTPEMRQQLMETMDALFNEPGFQRELAELASNMAQLNPQRGDPGEYSFFGDEPVSLQEAMRLMGDMNSLDELERELIEAARSNDATRIDSDEVDRLLGEEARHMIEEMKRLTEALEEAGLIRKNGKDWELTPRAMRKVGERALRDVFGRLKASDIGDHGLDRRGFGVERLEETKVYEYGDALDIDTVKSVANAIRREGQGTPVRMKIDDFEVHRSEMLAQCSTVIMLDMSYSMMHGGRFQAGRKVALALDSLIRSKFPKDNLYVVAFSYFVLTLKPQMLLDSYWIEYGGGTNFQEALRQARQTLAKHNSGTKQIIFITDGEPTTYSGWYGDGWGSRHGGGSVHQETLREVVRCTKDNITINTFMMARERELSEFVRLIAKLNRGRAFFSTPSRLGEYILLDYVTSKRRILH